jgi:hypothetical protein
MLSVDDADGKPIPVDVLSCGTREQIFLSLRLALVSAYARRGIRLPVVMDDVLVNFDNTRAKAAVGVLAEFARAGHQLLVFTCHEHLAQLFHEADVEVRALPGGVLPWTKPVRFQWDQPAPQPVRPIPPPHFVPEPAPAAAAAPPAPFEEFEEVAFEPVPPPPPPPPPVPIPAPAARRNGHAPRPRRAKPAVVARPAPEPRRRRLSSVESVPWSAEEFEGELVDRVRRSVIIEEELPPVRGESRIRDIVTHDAAATEESEDSAAGEIVESSAVQRAIGQVAWP